MGDRLWLGPCTCALLAPHAARPFSLAKTPAGVGLPPCLGQEAGPLIGRDGDVHFHSLGKETHQPQWL